MRVSGWWAGLAVLVVSACGGGDAPSVDPGAAPDSGAVVVDNPVSDSAATPTVPALPTAAAPITGIIHTVNMVGDNDGYRYEPAELTIKAGDGIRFVMVSNGPHNVAFDASLLPEGVRQQLSANMPEQPSELMGKMLLEAGEEYTMSFGGVAPGTYEFYCTPHLAMGMTGKVTVVP
jgi:plastocyanin